ncbi:3-oxoacyl-reductase [Pyrenochaeta sp. MPI-SDFR-AT-0127]|nr:3-oxoacyl-reductase [Pyrenochaeta sp. MPI-SDFR-AT-0127]
MSQPSLNTSPYSAILPQNLEGTNVGKIAVVTGAARGIGKAIAESLAKTGADVALLDLDAERQADTKAACEKISVKAYTYACDVTDYARCEEVFKQINKDLGAINVLVNNAGRNNRRPMSMESFPEFWAGVELNFKGAMIWSWLVLPDMRQKNQGCIINIASRAGTVSTPFAGAYSAGKSGLIRATSCMQAELAVEGYGDNIHVYALHPGAVKTDMTLPVHEDVAKRFPEMAATWASFHKIFKVLPSVCGQTCAYLAAGKGKALAGKYFDCEQDIEAVVGAGKRGLDGLYELKVDFLGDLPNDGGTALFGVSNAPANHT